MLCMGMHRCRPLRHGRAFENSAEAAISRSLHELNPAQVCIPTQSVGTRKEDEPVRVDSEVIMTVQSLKVLAEALPQALAASEKS